MAKVNIPSPAALSVGYGLRVISYDEEELQGVADSTGTVLLQSGYLAQDKLLRIERISVVGNSANTRNIGVYAGDNPIPQRRRDGTIWPAGFDAIAEYPSYLTIKPTLCLLIEVTGCVPGDSVNATYQFQLIQRVLGQSQWPSS